MIIIQVCVHVGGVVVLVMALVAIICKFRAYKFKGRYTPPAASSQRSTSATGKVETSELEDIPAGTVVAGAPSAVETDGELVASRQDVPHRVLEHDYVSAC